MSADADDRVVGAQVAPDRDDDDRIVLSADE